jgi:hypothetical protein
MRHYLTLLMILCLALAAHARWMRPDPEVPIARLLRNVETAIEADPEAAELHYLKGRLHSLAFALDTKTVEVYDSAKPRFQFLPWETLQVRRRMPDRALTPGELDHLRRSLQHYHRATTLDKKNALYRLGLAWMLEQAAPHAARLGSLPWRTDERLTASDVNAQALALYREAYGLQKDSDLASPGAIRGVADAFVSKEAAEGILRLAKEGVRPLVTAPESADLLNTVAKLKDHFTAITPIVFPLESHTPFARMIDPAARSRFDLAGDGRGQEWPWVTSSTAFLAWDPERTGQIRSGRQLFGSATFWMFFDDGYAVLASLDDDGDGWLTGKELDGIAV